MNVLCFFFPVEMSGSPNGLVVSSFTRTKPLPPHHDELYTKDMESLAPQQQ